MEEDEEPIIILSDTLRLGQFVARFAISGPELAPLIGSLIYAIKQIRKDNLMNTKLQTISNVVCPPVLARSTPIYYTVDKDEVGGLFHVMASF
jgi:hypothetical protein